ncbi:MAG: outer membrane beta-barrel protein [Balneolaceae bacterium]|nr:outer membrane beta-barrel protein [Balneolaceae bacterium]
MHSFLFRFLIVAALLVIPSLADAQFRAYGIKLGVESSSISGNYAESDKHHLGFSGYIFGDYPINSTQSVELNFGYSRRGFYRERVQPNTQALQSGSARAHSTMDYLTFSSILKLEYPRGASRPFIGIGPKIDYLVRTEAGSFNFSDGTTVEDPSVTYLKEAVFGFTVSAGITQLSLFGTRMRLSLNYQWDITDALETRTESAKINNFMLTAGLAFGS